MALGAGGRCSDGQTRTATVSVVVFSFPDHDAARHAASWLASGAPLPAGDVSLGTHAVMGGIHDGLPLLAAAVAPECVGVEVAILVGAGGVRRGP